MGTIHCTYLMSLTLFCDRYSIIVDLPQSKINWTFAGLLSDFTFENFISKTTSAYKNYYTRNRKAQVGWVSDWANIYILKNENLHGMTNWPNSSSFNWFASNVERLSEATEWHGGCLSNIKLDLIWPSLLHIFYKTLIAHILASCVYDSLVQLQLLLILRRFIGEPKVIIFCWCAGEEESEELDSRFLLFFISQLLAGWCVHGWRVVMAGIGIHSLRAVLRGKLYVANRCVDSRSRRRRRRRRSSFGGKYEDIGVPPRMIVFALHVVSGCLGGCLPACLLMMMIAVKPLCLHFFFVA